MSGPPISEYVIDWEECDPAAVERMRDKLDDLDRAIRQRHDVEHRGPRTICPDPLCEEAER